MLAALGLSASQALAGWVDVESETEAYYVCSAYLMADLYHFEHNVGDGDMDMAFQEALTAFATVAYEKKHSVSPSYVERLGYERDLVPTMLSIFLEMQRPTTENSQVTELTKLYDFCSDLGAKLEKTRWVFQ
ncbi:hypothetical protein [Parasedimentitalea huanghaiensis]|uniref:hypothetical protein n=1 Tax=Parasedimentitalea huanghaiensis TaxID=2682100 RepID=UPI0012EDF392|nr:hypothetical protein [Zongyanglinia huanghaiensis]